MQQPQNDERDDLAKTNPKKHAADHHNHQDNNEQDDHVKMNPTTRRQTQQLHKNEASNSDRYEKFNMKTPDHRANHGNCIVTKGAGESRSLSNHKGCQCHITTEREVEQSHRTCHKKGVLDIAYLTIHVDAGALAFTRCKSLPPRHLSCLPPRHLARRAKTHNTT